MSQRLNGYCFTCEIDVTLTQRPVSSTGASIRFEYICPRCRNPEVEIAAVQPQQPSQQQQSAQNPFNILLGNMMGPMLGMGLGLGAGAGLRGVGDMFSTLGLDPDNQSDFNAILRLIEDRERSGQSPTDPDVLKSLPRYHVTEEWKEEFKKKQMKEIEEKFSLKQQEELLNFQLQAGNLAPQLSNHTPASQQPQELTNNEQPTTSHNDIASNPAILTENQPSLIELENAFEDLECKICLCEPEINDELTKLPCEHYFHTECFLQWAKGHNTCPLCRHKLPLRVDNLSATTTLPNGATVQISTQSVDLNRLFNPNNSNPSSQDPNIVQGFSQRYVFNQHDRVIQGSLNSSPIPATSTSTTTTTTSTPRLPSLPAPSNSSGNRYEDIGGIRYIHRPDGTTVIIDPMGIRIRQADGTTNFIGTNYATRSLQPLPQVSQQQLQQPAQPLQPPQPNSPTLDSSDQPQQLNEITLNPPITASSSSPLSISSTPQPASSITSSRPLTTPCSGNLKFSGGGAYGKRFARPGTSAVALSATPTISSTHTTTSSSTPNVTNESLPPPPTTQITSNRPTGNPFKRNFQ